MQTALFFIPQTAFFKYILIINRLYIQTKLTPMRILGRGFESRTTVPTYPHSIVPSVERVGNVGKSMEQGARGLIGKV